MRTVDIPGGTAVLREAKDLTVRQRRMAESAIIAAASILVKLPADPSQLTSRTIAELGLTQEEADHVYEMQDAAIVAALESWSLPDPVPTLATVGDLKGELYDALAKASEGLIAGTDFNPPNPNSVEFAESPIVPSDGSVAGLRADQEQPSIETPPSSGMSTSTEPPSQD